MEATAVCTRVLWHACNVSAVYKGMDRQVRYPATLVDNDSNHGSWALSSWRYGRKSEHIQNFCHERSFSYLTCLSPAQHTILVHKNSHPIFSYVG
jgi:hypothetical protein